MTKLAWSTTPVLVTGWQRVGVLRWVRSTGGAQFVYDELGRMTKRTDAVGETRYGYRPTGQLAYAANNPLTYWDPAGRFSTELLATRTATIKQDGCQTYEWSTGATQLDCTGVTILDQITSFVSPGGIYETRYQIVVCH